MAMSKNFMQEEFSKAYVHAVTSLAGFKVFPPAAPDDDSVDICIGARGLFGSRRSPRIDLQLKCWQGRVGDSDLSYKLPIKNYDDLRHTDYQVPRFLVVVVVPEDPEPWHSQDHEALSLRRCGYWLSLRGERATNNSKTVTVSIPRENVFSVDSLGRMLDGSIGVKP